MGKRETVGPIMWDYIDLVFDPSDLVMLWPKDTGSTVSHHMVAGTKRGDYICTT